MKRVVDGRFPMDFDGKIRMVKKLPINGFSQAHAREIAAMQFSQQKLYFSDPTWSSKLLGSGEEKAVYAVCDGENHVFALELIDERYYLNGRLIGGIYFGEMQCAGIKGCCLHPEALVGLQFTGLVKPREYIRGFEWSRFHWNAGQNHFLDRLITVCLRRVFRQEFLEMAQHYGDAHDRNIFFELLPTGEGKTSLYCKNCDGKWEYLSVQLRGIDLR